MTNSHAHAVAKGDRVRCKQHDITGTVLAAHADTGLVFVEYGDAGNVHCSYADWIELVK